MIMPVEYNLIINLAGADWQIEKLKQRITSSDDQKIKEVGVLNLNSADINKPPSEAELEFFKNINNNSRIYVIDHGNPNSSNIGSANYQDLAEFFNKRLNKNNLKPDGEQKLRISLIPCHAAVGEDDKAKSFAGLFHRYLGQVCHINADVLARLRVTMINLVTDKKGKLTTHLAHYAFITKAYDLSLPKVLYEISESADKYHQQPNTKLVFKWDKNGNEYVVDAYLDKCVQRAEGIHDFLSEALKEAQIDTNIKNQINDYLNFIDFLCNQKENITYHHIYKIIETLLKIEILINKHSLDKKNDITAKINEYTKFFSLSVARNTKTIHYKVNIGDPPSMEIEPRHGRIKRDLSALAIIELKKMPKTELEKPLKKLTTSFLQTISNNTNTKIKFDRSIEREVVIANFIQNTLGTINAVDLSREEKIVQINELRENLEDSIHAEIFLSAKITGAIEGYQEAKRYGGLTALKTLFPLIEFRSKEEIANLTEYFKFIEQFTETSLEYLKNANYKGSSLEIKEVLEKEAQVLTEQLSTPLYHMIASLASLSSSILLNNIVIESDESEEHSLESPKMHRDSKLTSEAETEGEIETTQAKTEVKPEQIEQVLNESIALKKATEDKIQKLNFSLENSPNPTLKEINTSIVINEVKAKLGDLENAIQELQELKKQVA